MTRRIMHGLESPGGDVRHRAPGFDMSGHGVGYAERNAVLHRLWLAFVMRPSVAVAAPEVQGGTIPAAPPEGAP